MRDIRFITLHRGGSLTQENHRALMHWARACAQRAVSLLITKPDERLLNALSISAAWEQERATTGAAMKAAVAAHAAARDADDPVVVAVSRAVGHAVATAHMADHALGGSLYARKAINLAGKSSEEEWEWQRTQLQRFPEDLSELVLDAIQAKEKSFKMR